MCVYTYSIILYYIIYRQVKLWLSKIGFFSIGFPVNPLNGAGNS